VLLIHSDTCPPCQKLKPLLFEKANKTLTSIYTLKYQKDHPVNKLINLQKIPYSVPFVQGDQKPGIQHSDIKLVWQHIGQYKPKPYYCEFPATALVSSVEVTIGGQTVSSWKKEDES
jgi:hypothetical protein